eukprot:GILI01003623.1.p1 GENE.GILI01003623.1~~GILI01003623.1.p1  ORF type:complete len:807 (-),score=18.69 GILI01003623.1:623-2758(-)
MVAQSSTSNELRIRPSTSNAPHLIHTKSTLTPSSGRMADGQYDSRFATGGHSAQADNQYNYNNSYDDYNHFSHDSNELHLAALNPAAPAFSPHFEANTEIITSQFDNPISFQPNVHFPRDPEPTIYEQRPMAHSPTSQVQLDADVLVCDFETDNFMPSFPTTHSKDALTITRRRKKAALADTQADFAIPLKVKPVPSLHLERVRDRLNPKFASRWDYLFNLLEEYTIDETTRWASSNSQRLSLLPSEDAARLVDNKIARRVLHSDPPAEGYAIPFTVKEHEGREAERRFILWTKHFNEWLSSRYSPDLDLKYVGFYLDSVRGECAALRDLATSFFQVPLPPSVSRKLRFFDMANNEYEILRFPMGLSLSVEIMQMICRSIGGDHEVVLPQYFHPPGHLDVWVDNLRFISNNNEVNTWNQQVESAAHDCGVTFKPSATILSSKQYDFIGVHFDHDKKRVCPSENTINKIPNIKSSISFLELEKLVGRLIFCASVSRVPLVKHYLTLKWARRLFNRANRGDLDLFSTIKIPPSIRAGLRAFIASSTSHFYVLSTPHAHVTLFTDASKEGWGAVFVDDINRMRVIGSRWSNLEKQNHINILEGEAVHRAINQLDLVEHFGKEIRLYVDNTSVQQSMSKGNTRSDNLAPVIDRCVSVLQNFSTVRIGYITSKDNPADFASRNFAPMVEQTCALGGRAETFLATGENTSVARFSSS